MRSRGPFFVEVAERALAEAAPLLRPGVLYRQLAVESLAHERLTLGGGGSLSSPLIGQHLAAASQVVVIVCTIGHRLEELVAQIMAADLQYGLALDGVGSAATDALAAAACHHFELGAEREGTRTTTPISPGMIGWPVDKGQRQIFDLLNPEEIGVTLLPSGMMVPRKSLSLVMGIGAGVSADGVPCDYCTMRDRCRYRSN